MPIIAGSYIRSHHIWMLCDAQSDVCSGDTETVEKKKQWIIMAPAAYELHHYKTIKG